MVFVWVFLIFVVVGAIVALCGGFFAILLKALIAFIGLVISLATAAFFPVVICIGLYTVIRKVLKKE